MGLLAPEEWSAHWIGAEAGESASAPTLVIRHATYEAVDGAGSADVTAAVAGQVKKDRLNLVVNNKNLGQDPTPNHVKQLRVEYELGGRVCHESDRRESNAGHPG